MNNKTKAVDVLAVLEKHHDAAFGPRPLEADELAGCRAALSALIGVAQSGKRDGDEQERREWLAELDAALARVQGGA